jgi:hypothetical protein
LREFYESIQDLTETEKIRASLLTHFELIDEWNDLAEKLIKLDFVENSEESLKIIESMVANSRKRNNEDMDKLVELKRHIQEIIELKSKAALKAEQVKEFWSNVGTTLVSLGLIAAKAFIKTKFGDEQ